MVDESVGVGVLYLVPFRPGFDPEEPYPEAEKRNDRNQQLTD